MAIIEVEGPGVIGMPAKRKVSRIDFDPGDFDRLIEEKGARFAWSRAADCPCVTIETRAEVVDFANVVKKTPIPDPGCPVCSGEGFFYFRPSDDDQSNEIGDLTELQESVVGDEASVIRGFMAGIESREDVYQPSGRFIDGQAMVTVRPGNRLGYYDRLVHLDSEVTYREVIEAPAPGQPLPLKFKAGCVNLLARVVEVSGQVSLDRFDATQFFVSSGQVCFESGSEPAQGARLSVHYQTNPSWIVMSHPHTIRATPVIGGLSSPGTPVGDSASLPIQAKVMLEFLVR